MHANTSNSPTLPPTKASHESVGFLHESSAFASILRVERMRSDRSGMPFALAVFSIATMDATFDAALDAAFDAVIDPQDDDAAPHDLHLAYELKKRVRLTDHVGRMSNNRVGVILWNTDAEGALSFVEKAKTMAGFELPLDCEVFVYPTTFPASDDEIFGAASECRPQTDIEEARELTERQLAPQRPAEPADGQTTEHETTPLELLFVRPMPTWKRAIDLLGAGLGFVLLAPLFVVVAAAIKLTSPGPIFFTQLRAGRGGRPFRMYKFRSMVADAEQWKQSLLEKNEQDGPAFKMENDPRITAVGRIIRKTSIDELPQLLNVVRGEMSLVGPRPLLCSEADACESWQRMRLDVTPGLTCIWQVQDSRTKIPFADWARMDIRYIGSRTLKHDLQLVLKTIRSIVGRRGA